MANYVTTVEQLIGNTPLIELKRVEEKFALKARLFAKLESFNPGGSAKDRVAVSMLNDAEQKGLIGPGSVIIEPTSGNTGIGLASVGTARGYRVIIVMPDSMSMERRILMGAFGAELVLTDGKEGMSGAIRKAEELSKTIPGSFIPSQFTNPANAKAHYDTTGPEICRDLDGKADAFVCTVGTGGTITGTGRYLKEKIPSIRVIAVEPAGSPVLSGGQAGPHGIQGIGAGFVPEVLDTKVYDEILTVTDEAAYETGRMLGKTEGILAGISSGAALEAAIRVAGREEYQDRNVVVLLPDTGDRYLSTAMFQNE